MPISGGGGAGVLTSFQNIGCDVHTNLESATYGKVDTELNVLLK